MNGWIVTVVELTALLAELHPDANVLLWGGYSGYARLAVQQGGSDETVLLEVI